jgi:predicted AlkP superfamily phosphohydrolase/phosphomutase
MKTGNNRCPKVLFIGIDAADPDYMDHRVDNGGLPNFKSFREAGVWSRMRSTFPVLSSAAWSTISTGLPPEKHGIYEFFRRKPGTWTDEPVHGGSKSGECFWEVAARHGLNTVTINMGMTYPPKAVPNGVVVAGMDTPGEGTAFVEPPEEKSALLRAVPDYKIELTAPQYHDADHFLDAISNQIDARMKAARFLFDRHQPDLAVVVFTAADRILHALWKYVDPNHPAYESPEAAQRRTQVDRIYDQIDSCLGELMDWAGSDATIIITSDHGGGAVHGIFYLNRWLAQEGYLAIREDAKFATLKTAENAQLWIKRNIPRGVKNIFNRMFPDLHTSVGTRLGLSVINPEKTRLYGWRKADVLRVNLWGREPGGTVSPGKEYEKLLQEVKDKLEAVVDPRNGRKPICKVWTRYEAYPLAGELTDCPDLVIEWGDYLYECDTTLEDLDGPLFTSEEKPNEPFGVEQNGKHARHGIFGIQGPDINRDVILEVMDIINIAPTVIAALGLDVPAAMTGNVPDGLFTGEVRKEMPEETETAKTPSRKEGEEKEVYSDKEREEIEKRLRDLGYM